MIPAGQAMALAYDAIEAGTLPEIQRIDDLFSDSVHMNGVGQYLVACVMYATVYQNNPLGAAGLIYQHSNPLEQIGQEVLFRMLSVHLDNFQFLMVEHLK